MADFKYTKDHECIYVEGDVASVGITQHAQDALGDLVFIELPDTGKSVAVGDEVAVVESVKTAAEVYTPVAGEIVEVNSPIVDELELISSPINENGWLIKLKISDASALDSLMDDAAYAEYLKEID
ncbi:MAG: glycine cleavage system protein GcvH [Alphaproteobacteria bacterium]